MLRHVGWPIVALVGCCLGSCRQSPDASIVHDARVDVSPFDARQDAPVVDGPRADSDLSLPRLDARPTDVPGPAPDTGGSLPTAAGVYPYDLCEPADPEARFVGESGPPAALAPGSSAAVWIVFANCGTQTWTASPATAETGHKLGSQAPQDNTSWGSNRVALGGDVQPGEMVRIDFTITAPAQPGSYGYQWKIVDEQVAWLEQAGPLHTVTVQATTAAATLADLWAGTAHFVVDQDPVPVSGPSSGHREAFAVNRPDVGPATIYLYHRCFGQSAADASICLSISPDGGSSFPQFLGEIVGPDPGHFFSVAASVIAKNNTWIMVYEESHVATIYWAESPDGISWTKKGALLAKDPQAWDGGALATPGVFLDTDGTIHVFYAGFAVGGVNMSIGYASGSSMTSLVKHAANPVLVPPAAGWDRGQVSMPRVVKQGGYYYMVHEGAEIDYTCYGYNRYGWGLARSSDLQSWSPLAGNPLGQSSSGCGNDMPSLFIRADGQVFAYHTSADTKRIVREHLVFK